MGQIGTKCGGRGACAIECIESAYVGKYGKFIALTYDPPNKLSGR